MLSILTIFLLISTRFLESKHKTFIFILIMLLFATYNHLKVQTHDVLEFLSVFLLTLFFLYDSIQALVWDVC